MGAAAATINGDDGGSGAVVETVRQGYRQGSNNRNDGGMGFS